MRKMERKSKSALAVFAGLLLVGMFLVPAVSAESEQTDSIGVKSVEILDAGELIVDETGGMTCVADAKSFNARYVRGLTYKIKVNCEYIETGDEWLQTARFFLKDSGGRVLDSKEILDTPGGDESWRGTLEYTFRPNSANDVFNFEISCSGGSESASDVIDIIFHE
ncbi:hypothetical protein RJ40_12575 [Methanofollis aquaemaris]|uniref:Uncharacterized protein n=1 Tax=Methanofollis aquaemaris TaxID=126734 RepID=A0A8A3S8Y1_9EURY|nr:hypothetical protein [Methanofollis aquaemaris]QSZ68269.1 hypothetical protein RJ40_12575 [Methanofollis aquaemaris]